MTEDKKSLMKEAEPVGKAPEYWAGSWSGVPHYRCNLCPLDSFDRMAMLRHLVDRHESVTALEELVRIEDEARASVAIEEAKNATNDIN